MATFYVCMRAIQVVDLEDDEEDDTEVCALVDHRSWPEQGYQLKQQERVLVFSRDENHSKCPQ
eukprot:5064276-Amphidinium_carterae.1